jgi:DNA polymerase III delta prime subunit
MEIKHSILAEKYRPKSLDTYMGNEKLKEFIQQCIDNNDIPHLLLYGDAGTGKTSLAKLIVNNMDCDYLYINSSDERGIDTIRDKVSRFASSVSFTSIKVVILDEADYITPIALASLRNVIETFSSSTRFILTCNYIEKIIDPIKSRCQTIKILPPSKSEIAKHLSWVLEEEKIIYELNDIALIVNKHYPDLRKMLNSIQLFTDKKDNTLKIDQSILTSSVYVKEVISKLRQPTYHTLKEIRQIIANSNVSDFDELYDALFRDVDLYAKDINVGLVIITLEEYYYKSNFKIDKEINIIACISKILEIIKK